MADTATIIANNNNNNNENEIKPKIQIKSTISGNGIDKSPSPATKLLLNHGKPNFTIQRSPKAEENGNAGSPLSPQLQNGGNNNYNPYKSANSYQKQPSNNILIGTKFNGVFKPSKIAVNDAVKSSDTENEAAKVVLRRAKVSETPQQDAEDENVPEFIRRQRRIQERLAKENILDFESRRSGYFTHVMISPDSPNRTSFVETMSSPAIVPALEIPPPQHQASIEEEQAHELEPSNEIAAQAHATPAVATLEEKKVTVTQPQQEPEPEPVAVVTNGHVVHEETDVEPDVAQAIEEVNKAVAGEDEPEVETVVTPVPVAVTSAPLEVTDVVPNTPQPEVVPTAVEAKVQVHADAAEPTAEPTAEPAAVASAEPHVALENGHAEQNGHADAAEITISHTNGAGNDGPSIPTPDPSGALGVNFEPKTVVSFAQELGSGENKYPDTVKIVKDGELVEKPASTDDLQDLTKLKFEISGEAGDVQVQQVIKTE